MSMLLSTAAASATIQTDGLFLLGLGALLLAVVGIASAPLRLHLQFTGLGDSRHDRLVFAGNSVGLMAAAVGSLLVAIGSTPTVFFVLVTVVVLVAVGWLLMAWRVHVLWTARRNEAALILRNNQDLQREVWRFAAAALLARWVWCLQHPLTVTDATNWPYPYLETRLGPEPPGVADEWFSSEGAYLRQNRPSLVRLTAATAPEWLRDIVAVAEDQRWPVLHAGTAVLLYTPDGTGYVNTRTEHSALLTNLVRQQLLRQLQEAGFPTHTGKRGQTLPGRDLSHRFAATERSGIPAGEQPARNA